MNNFFSISIARLLGMAAVFLLFIALVVPNRLADIHLQALLCFPIELLLVGFILLIPNTLGKALRWLLASGLAAGVIFKIADIATYNVFARPFNPIFDAYLLRNGMHLLSGSLGEAAAMVIGVLLVALVLLIIALAFLMLHSIRELLLGYRTMAWVLLACGLVLWGGLRFADSRFATAAFYELLAMHTRATMHSIQDAHAFRTELQQAKEQAVTETPVGQAKAGWTTAEDAGALFSLLEGKDVLIIFIESYGRTLLDKPEFATHFRPFLQQQEQKLLQAGIAMRSAYLTSPTFGGLSWFAHGTAMSGLWINSQTRYDTLVMSDHPSINRLFRTAGWRTVAVMPAISMAWPEGDYFGYDKVYDAHNSGYQGMPFNWVTMPDQFTLAAFQRNELDVQQRKPVMAEIALISSHAPWTPVPELVDWRSVGDGQVFNTQAVSGDTPEALWKDPDRVRLQFRLAIEYSVGTVVDYLLHYATDNTVVLVLGDHQPAPLVTGVTDNRDVPVHFFARDPNVMEAIANWNWAGGLTPADASPVWRMDEVKNKWIETFSHSMLTNGQGQ